MKIYTKKGDSGFTDLLNGERVSKADERIELLGSIDEFTSFLGIAKVHIKNEEIANIIHEIQQKLIVFMAAIADGKSDTWFIEDKDIFKIENFIDEYEEKFPREKKFVVPGGSKVSAYMDTARTLARKTERSLTIVSEKYIINDNLKKYINRISDLLYLLARYLDFEDKVKEKVMEALNKNITFTKNKSINLENAKVILQRVEDKAKAEGLATVIAVANSFGNIIAVHSMDGAYLASYDIAVNKAYTSASLKMSTEELSKLARPDGPLYGINTTNNNRIVIFGGGEVLRDNDIILGSIGVSGGTAEQDSKLAAFGAHVFKEMIK